MDGRTLRTNGKPHRNLNRLCEKCGRCGPVLLFRRDFVAPTSDKLLKLVIRASATAQSEATSFTLGVNQRDSEVAVEKLSVTNSEHPCSSAPFVLQKSMARKWNEVCSSLVTVPEQTNQSRRHKDHG